MAQEYTSVCHSCGHTWQYNDADLREMERLRGQVRNRGIISVLGALKGDSVNAHIQTGKMQETGSRIVDYSKCPVCGSMDVTTNATFVDNWLLDDPSSPLFAGAISDDDGEFHGPKSKVVAAILAILLGWCGAHKFYLGYVREGAIVIAFLAFVGAFIPLIPALVTWLLGVIEGVIYLIKDDETFNRTYVQGRRGWL